VSAMPPFQAATTFLQLPRKSYRSVLAGHIFSGAESGTEYQPGITGGRSGEFLEAWSGTSISVRKENPARIDHRRRLVNSQKEQGMIISHTNTALFHVFSRIQEEFP
jgi:hypothetical protein